MARRWDGTDTGEDGFGLCDGDGDGHGSRSAAERCTDAAEGMGPADAGSQLRAAIDGPAIACTGDDRCAGGGCDGSSSARVVAVAMGQEDAFERAAEVGDGGEDGRSAIGEAGIDQGEAAGGKVDEEDVGAAGAAEPADTGDDVVGEGSGHAMMVAGRGGRCPGLRLSGLPAAEAGW